MYAYINAYKSAERCLVIYPKVDEPLILPKWKLHDGRPEKFIDIQTVRLDRFENTIKDLSNAIIE